MKLLFLGMGYVGLVSAVGYARHGHDCYCIDVNPKRIETLKKGKSPIFEEGIEAALTDTITAKRLHFGNTPEDYLEGVAAVFICVGTPQTDKGTANLSYLFQAVHTLGKIAKEPLTLIIKSTVPIGTNRQISEMLKTEYPNKRFTVLSNPEFLKEGTALQDFDNPDRIVVGSFDGSASLLLEEINAEFMQTGCPILACNWETAETVKYAANAFLATKITFINEFSRFCEATGANVHLVAKGIGLDPRIGSDFLRPGPGYGGSCFPKDTRAVAYAARDADTKLSLVEAVIASNEEHKQAMVAKIEAALGGEIAGKSIAIWGLAFKAHTDDMREASALTIVPALLKHGALLSLYDPQAMDNACMLLGDKPFYAPSAEEAAQNADLICVLTEWPEFKAVPLTIFKGRILVDLRSLFDRETIHKAGGYYIGLGEGTRL